ncbi:N-acetyl-beta-D-galactosaminidase [Aureococcus anophagefferens]|nr:N-acetyl-beta-D-galactosaminidase [Aureococcus anophagefferens]
MEGPSGQPSRATGQRALDFLVGSAVCVALFSAASTRPFLRGEAPTTRRLAATRTDDARCLVVTPDGVEADESACAFATTAAAASTLTDCSNFTGAGGGDCGSLLWPLPASYAAGSTDLCVPTSLAFELDGEARTSAVVRGAVERYAAYIFAHGDLDATPSSTARSRLNVLHLHLSDQESFPMESRRFPELWASAFSDYEVYTEHVPGAPEGVCMASCDMSDDDTVDNVPLRPGSKTLAFLDGLYGEFLDGGDDGAGPVFPYAFAHVGGDEVKDECWNVDDVSRDWMRARGLNSTSTYRLMLDHVRATVASRGKRAIAWNDAYEYFGNGLDESWVFMFWTEIDEMVGAAQAGHHVISAWDMELYLDYGSNQVEGIYNFDPCAYDDGLNETTLCDMVLGESVNFWSSDYDAANLAGTLFPRAAALAERAWSPRDLITYTNFTLDATQPTGNVTTNLRLGHFRCELLARGVRAGPVNVPWDKAYGSAAPPETGSCMFQ